MTIKYLLIIIIILVNVNRIGARFSPEKQPDCGSHGAYSKTKGCICEKGYDGPLCEFSGCKNNGMHLINGDGYDYCRCRPGYTGDRCELIDCGINGKFDLETGDCICKNGFDGTFCDKCKNQDLDGEFVNICCPIQRSKYAKVKKDQEDEINKYNWVLVTISNTDLPRYVSGMSTKPNCITTGVNITTYYDGSKKRVYYTDCDCTMISDQDILKVQHIRSTKSSRVITYQEDNVNSAKTYEVIAHEQSKPIIERSTIFQQMNGPGYYIFILVILVISLTGVAMIIIIIFGLLADIVSIETKDSSSVITIEKKSPELVNSTQKNQQNVQVATELPSMIQKNQPAPQNSSSILKNVSEKYAQLKIAQTANKS